MLTDPVKAALLEEIRFAKRQQWTITAAVVGLIAGAYTIAVEKQSLDPWEQAIAAILVVVVAFGGIYWLIDLQRHLYRTDCASIHTILIRGGEGPRLSMGWQAL